MLKKTFEYRKTTDGLQTTDRQVAPLLFVYLCLLSHSLFYSLIICKNDVISFFQSNYFELNYSPQTNSIVVNTAASLSGKILNLLLFFIKAHRSSVCCPNWLNPSPINLNFYLCSIHISQSRFIKMDLFNLGNITMICMYLYRKCVCVVLVSICCQL